MLTLFLMSALQVKANPFPKGKTFYFTNGSRSTCIQATFGIDDYQDHYCFITTPVDFVTYILTQTTHEWRFQGYKSEPTYKMSEGYFKFLVPTGKLQKVRNNNWMTLSGDYNTLVLNGETYKVRISKEEFNRLYHIFSSGNTNSTYSPAYTNNSGVNKTMTKSTTTRTKTNNNTSRTRDCSVCNGTGVCTMGGYGGPSGGHCAGTGTCRFCSGNGHLMGNTSSTTPCPNCDGKLSNGFGNGKCNFCHGTGRCHSCNGTGKKKY